MSVAARVGSCLVVLAGLAAPAAAQERAVPDFPARADAITVDVVVLGKDGRPIRGLKASDFTVREDGKPQTIVGFEARDLAAAPSEGADVALGLPRADGEELSGRTLGFLVDDLGLDLRGNSGIEAMRRWVRDHADPRDEVTLATTSGAQEWQGRIGSGRAELLQMLDSIRFLRPPLSFFTSIDGQLITERQAFRIFSGRDQGTTSGSAMATAHDVYDWWRRRARAVVAAIGAFTRAHAAERGRKPLFVLTQGFIEDLDLRPFDDAIDVAQRGNTAVYFLDTRGLIAGGLSASSGATAPSVQSGLPSAGSSMFGDAMDEVTHGLDMGGAERVARESGGALIRDTNDLDGRLVAAVDESSAFYLLGFQPAAPDDGKWHDIDVAVAVKGATVRARRGYHASAQTLVERRAQAARENRKEKEKETAAAPKTRAEPSPPAASGAAPAEGAARDVPVFASQADAITVDVVVTDKDGRPVRDLAAHEFTLFEDGQAMPIVGFEPHVSPAPEPLAPAPVVETAAASNERPASAGGRTQAFLIDDLGIEPTHMPAVVQAIGGWIATGAAPRDAVTIATSSGDAWWSDFAGSGRADFDAVLARLRGKQRPATGQDAISDFEAYRIDLQGPGDAGLGQGTATPGPPTGASCATGSDPSNVRDRIVDRWFRTGACLCEPMNVAQSVRSCRGQVTVRATDVYRSSRQRAQAVLGGVERISRGLAGARGRKSVMVFSESLLRDAQQSAFEGAVDASRHGNTAVSFVDVRGLVGLSFFGAEQSAAAAPSDVGSLTAETTRLTTAGGEYLAQTTGGSMVSDSNDLAGGVARVADESSAYYLLGYQPDRPPDGKWRRLEVKIARPGVKVRARRGYFATAPAAASVAKTGRKDKKRKKDDRPVRTLDPALAVGGERDGIPLRIAPYVMEADATGTTRVVVALEVGTGALTFAGTGAERTAEIEVTVLGVSRDGKSGEPLDSHVSLGLDAKAVGGFWMFSRELRLPRGPAQVRALVRDTVSGRSGLVSQRLEIPDPAAPYMSTPILSDRIAPAAAGRSARLVPVAHRTFPANGVLYCAYEVHHSAPGRELGAMPQVTGAYRIEDEAGRVVAEAPPTPIAIALGAQIVRVLAFPLDRLGPGRYRLTIQAADRAKGLDLQWRETFVVEPPIAAPATGR